MPGPPYRSPDKFDRAVGALDGLPDVTRSKPSPISVVTPIIGQAETFIVQTFRQKDVGDFIALQYIDDRGATRIVLPPAVAETIARQRDALTTKVRRKVGKESAAARKARGEVPGFLKHKRRPKKAKPQADTK